MSPDSPGTISNFGKTALRRASRIFSMDDAPASVGLVYDCSGSMHDKMGQSAAAVAAFFHTANVEDESSSRWSRRLAEASVTPSLRTWTTLTRILRTKPFGRTALLDALAMAMKQMKKSGESA